MRQPILNPILEWRIRYYYREMLTQIRKIQHIVILSVFLFIPTLALLKTLVALPLQFLFFPHSTIIENVLNAGLLLIAISYWNTWQQDAVSGGKSNEYFNLLPIDNYTRFKNDLTLAILTNWPWLLLIILASSIHHFTADALLNQLIFMIDLMCICLACARRAPLYKLNILLMSIFLGVGVSYDSESSKIAISLLSLVLLNIKAPINLSKFLQINFIKILPRHTYFSIAAISHSKNSLIARLYASTIILFCGAELLLHNAQIPKPWIFNTTITLVTLMASGIFYMIYKTHKQYHEYLTTHFVNLLQLHIYDIIVISTLFLPIQFIITLLAYYYCHLAIFYISIALGAQILLYPLLYIIQANKKEHAVILSWLLACLFLMGLSYV